MRSMLRRLFRCRPKEKVAGPPRKRIIFAEAAIKAFRDALSKDIRDRNEGITYLFGQSDGSTTLVVAVFKPESENTSGSFFVSSLSMAKVVRAASNLGLQVVGQVHTHPGQAFHSNGDDSGARIAYSGYVSIVIPSYGRHLPSLVGAAFFMFHAGSGFVQLSSSNISIILGVVQ